MNYTPNMDLTAFYKKDAVEKLRELIISSAQQNRSVLQTDFPVSTWNLCSMFGQFYEDNFEESCQIKSTSFFSDMSSVAQKEIEEYYMEIMMLICLYQHNVMTPLASDFVAPAILNYLADKSPKSAERSTSHGMPDCEELVSNEVSELGKSDDCQPCENNEDMCKSDALADMQNAEITDDLT